MPPAAEPPSPARRPRGAARADDPAILPFLRSRLPALALWNGGAAAGAAVLALSPAVRWPAAEAAYAMALGLAAQLAWLGLEWGARKRLSAAMRDGAEPEPGLGPLRDEDLLLGELRRRERELELAASRRREELDRYSDYLVYLAHELKTPLTSLRLGLSALAEVPPGRGDGRGPTAPAALLAELGALEAKADEALFYARSHSFAEDFLVKPTRPDELVRRSLASLAGPFVAKAMAPAFGPGFRAAEAGAAAVLSDPVWLGFIVEQLLLNAVKYAPTGSAVELELRDAGDELELVVADRGPGVEPGDLPRLFDRGFVGQARDRSGERERSTGLGLYLVRTMAARLGHRVEARANPGGGLAVLVAMRRY